MNVISIFKIHCKLYIILLCIFPIHNCLKYAFVMQTRELYSDLIKNNGSAQAEIYFPHLATSKGREVSRVEINLSPG